MSENLYVSTGEAITGISLSSGCYPTYTTSTSTVTVNASSFGGMKEYTAKEVDKEDEKEPVTFEVKEVKVINDDKGRERKVIVTLKNGDTFTATCSAEDEFNLEYGVTVALLKASLAHLKSDNPSRDFSKGVRQCIKLYEKGVKEEEDAEKEKELIKRRKEKARLKKQKRMERRKENAIDIQKEAFLRALMEYDNLKNEPQEEGRG